MQKITKYILLCITVVMTCAVLAGCYKEAEFSGSKTGDDDRFDIDFEVLNRSYSHEFDMKAGESIDVSITRKSGNISIEIKKEDADPIYRGNDLDTANFNVKVKEDGIYKVTVKGEKAKGHVVFERHEDPNAIAVLPTDVENDPTKPSTTPEPEPTAEPMPTKEITPEPTAEPTVEPTTEPTPTEQPRPEILDIPLSKRLAEQPDSIRKVFESEGKFVYVETDYTNYSLTSGAQYTIESFQPYISESSEHPEEYTAVMEAFTIIDLDHDGKNEIVCLISSVMHGLAQYLILSDVDGRAYGYLMVYRGFVPLMADGRAWGSGGATSGRLYRFIAFTADGYETETLVKEDDPYYEIAGSQVSRELFHDFCIETFTTDSMVLWIPCDTVKLSPDNTAKVKYSNGGTITLYYEDQVIDITKAFRYGVCLAYLIDNAGNPMYVTIRYKGEIETGRDDFKSVSSFSEAGFFAEDYTTVVDPYHDFKESLEGRFRIDEHNRIRIWRGELVLCESDDWILKLYDAEDEKAYKLADNAFIWLFSPIRSTYGCFVTRDGFLHTIKDAAVDCYYHLNDKGQIDDIRGIYYP